MNRRASRAVAISVFLCLSITAIAIPATRGGAQTIQGTTAPSSVVRVASALKLGAPAPAAGVNVSLNYDEQMGLTYTQDRTALSFNVTAVEQTFNDSYGAGPGYLVCGLSSAGYWYEVGLGWNWPYDNGGYSPGFSLMYEVFDAGGNSIYPSDGGLGLANFTSSVNANDNVNIALSISSGNVVMAGYDYTTKSSASQSYSAEGASDFLGLSGQLANSNGYFTGLLTEQYHANPYYGPSNEVVYSESSFAFASAWMWVDEYNGVTGQTQFFDQSSSPVSFSSPSQLHEYSANGATEYADANEFITGTLTSSTTSTSTTASTTSTATTSSSSTASSSSSTASSSSSSTTSTATTSSSSTASSSSTTAPTVTVTQIVTTTLPQTTQTTTQTTTTTQTATTTQTTTQTTTTTQTLITTQTATSTETSTTTLPPTTVTSTQTGPTTTVVEMTTTTQTTTSTTTVSSSSLPAWGYAIMVLLLIIGTMLGYLLSQTKIGRR
ncbi:MAG: hypothetical protein ABSF83_07100 [Nitrososphaerales archaeon]|jgi:hypothetical protein